MIDAVKPKKKKYVTVLLRETNGTGVIQMTGMCMEDTIVELQWAVEHATTIAPRLQELYFGSQRIDWTATGNAKITLREIGICANSPPLVLVNECPNEYLQVELIEYCGKTTMIDMTTTSTIIQLQHAVTDKTGVPVCHQRLHFCCKRIDGGIKDPSKVTLRDVGISRQNKRVVMHGGFCGGGGTCAGCGSNEHRSNNATCPNYAAMQGKMMPVL